MQRKENILKGNEKQEKKKWAIQRIMIHDKLQGVKTVRST